MGIRDITGVDQALQALLHEVQMFEPARVAEIANPYSPGDAVHISMKTL